MYRIGVDIGGTFTDFALYDARGSRMSVHKRLTTPHDPSQAVTEGIAALLKADSVAIGDVTEIVHGTTLVTNAVIERRGAVTGMLATAATSSAWKRLAAPRTAASSSASSTLPSKRTRSGTSSRNRRGTSGVA